MTNIESKINVLSLRFAQLVFISLIQVSMPPC